MRGRKPRPLTTTIMGLDPGKFKSLACPCAVPAPKRVPVPSA